MLQRKERLIGYLVAVAVAAGVSFAVLNLFATSVEYVEDPYAYFKDLSTARLIDKISDDNGQLLSLTRSFMEEEEAEAILAALIELAERREYARTVPVLARSILSSDALIRDASRQLLSEIGEPAVEALGVLFDSGEDRDFYAGCEAVRSIGAPAAKWTEACAAGLDSENGVTRIASLFALSEVGAAAVPYREKVISQLDSENMNVRLWGCRVLAALGPEAAPAASRLQRLLEEGVPSDRSLASVALAAIGPSNDYDLFALLRQQLNAFSQLEKERALQAAGTMGAAAAPLKDDVAKLMRDASKHSLVPAALAYWQITRNTDEPLQVLIEQFADLTDRPAAAEALGQMGEAAQPALTKLIEALDDEDEVYRQAAVEALGNLGAVAEPAMAKLRKVADDDRDRWIRHQAKRAIAAIEATR